MTLKQICEERIPARRQLDRCIARYVEPRFKEGRLERQVLAIAERPQHDPTRLESTLLNEKGVKEDETGFGDAFRMYERWIMLTDDLFDALQLGLL